MFKLVSAEMVADFSQCLYVYLVKMAWKCLLKPIPLHLTLKICIKTKLIFLNDNYWAPFPFHCSENIVQPRSCRCRPGPPVLRPLQCLLLQWERGKDWQVFRQWDRQRGRTNRISLSTWKFSKKRFFILLGRGGQEIIKQAVGGHKGFGSMPDWTWHWPSLWPC